MSDVYTVQNPDVRGLAERIDRARYEVLKSGSARGDDVRGAVRSRIDRYNERLQNYIDVIFDEPEMDYPKSYPDSYDVKTIVTTEMQDIENLELRDLDTLYAKFFLEAINSASAHRESGITPDDKTRFDSYMTRIRDFLVKFIDATNPGDFPESMPSQDGVSDGVGTRY